MKRRSFLGFLGLAAAAPVATSCYRNPNARLAEASAKFAEREAEIREEFSKDYSPATAYEVNDVVKIGGDVYQVPTSGVIRSRPDAKGRSTIVMDLNAQKITINDEAWS